ncbi:MAG: zinc-ribbon domain-containing protein [Roseinatronobacter sp.]
MRLICPNCAAQYEIDAALIPDDGREVQCSACNTIWFEPGARDSLPGLSQPEAAPAAETAAATVAGTRAAGTSAPHDAAPAAAPADSPAQADGPTQADSLAQEDDPEDWALEPAPPPRPIDPKVRDILRAEAEFEAAQRALEAERNRPERSGAAQGLEFLDRAHRPGTFATPAAGSAAPVGAADASAAADDSPADDRALPDIGRISATLDPIGVARTVSPGAPQLPASGAERSRSFLRGLMVPIVVALVLTGVYLGAPVIADTFPGLIPALERYTDLVEDLRHSLSAALGL